MAIKKSDLYSSLWRSCDELRGGMDASQYKDYILTLLFVKYVSDKRKADRFSPIDIPAGGSFDEIVALKNTKDIGEEIDKAIGRLAEANGLHGVIDVAFFNDENKIGRGREMVHRLSKLVAIFEGLDFRTSRAQGDDLLGDAYEYLMRHFATESGKSKGQFYTPAEVSRVLAKIVGIGPETRQDQTVYDMACGSGSLLLKAADEAPNGLSVYGQEKDSATWALCKMNMILHGYETAEIENGDTISSPGFAKEGRLKRHDFLVANPPFSSKSWSSGIVPASDAYGRFELGVPPAKNGDYAFLLHALASLKSSGIGAVVLPHGVLFRGHSEGKIRRELLRRGYIKGVIGLPPNLFYGTSIPACIVVLDKAGGLDKGDNTARKAAPEAAGTFLIDASRGFRKDGNKNRLRPRDIHLIVDVFTNQIEIDGYSRLVPLSEIAEPANDYNLNLSRYIDASPPDDIHDLEGHLLGGVPERDLDGLSDFWNAFPSLRSGLFERSRPGYQEAKGSPAEVKTVIEESPELATFREGIAARLDGWWASHNALLRSIGDGLAPRELIWRLSEDLLALFAETSLVSPYEVYEQLMTYWADIMQDDTYLIAAEGWVQAALPRSPLVDKARKLSEDPDLVVGAGRAARRFKMDLVPPGLVAARYFPTEQVEVERLRVALERTSKELEDYQLEHGVEGGLLEEIVNEKGKATRGAVKALLKTLEGDPDRADELAAAVEVERLLGAEATAKQVLATAEDKLSSKVVPQYSSLSREEVETLVIETKWLPALRAALNANIAGIVAQPVERIRVLLARYREPLPNLRRTTDDLAATVDHHLVEMGLTP